MTERRFLTRKEASRYLYEQHGIRLSPETLASMASKAFYVSKGAGPRYRRDGRFTVYPVDELDAFAARRLSPLVSCTQELSRGPLKIVGGD